MGITSSLSGMPNSVLIFASLKFSTLLFVTP
ncbi:hypothetical protein VST7929_02962 [Vibrio stylophorae]|uniref:Uncharacterized protein n=1 Tax=Vibrio stylophorae TaxID=659351 RepID=A0ABM8ZXE0_9VIBR|nr:hypothetical protein VST7929_02962 [Vibrio stylophorae]